MKETLDKLAESLTAIDHFNGTLGKEIRLDSEKMNSEELKEVLEWFVDGGTLEGKTYEKNVKMTEEIRYHFTVKKGGIIMSAGTVIIPPRRKSTAKVSGWSNLCGNFVRGVIAEADQEKAEKLKKEGHEYRIKDGTLMEWALKAIGSDHEVLKNEKAYIKGLKKA